MDEAIAHYHQHPRISISAVSEAKKSQTTLLSRINGTHAPRGVKANRNPSSVEAGVMVDRIHQFAFRKTLLQPRQIREIAELR
jgi:hypothetical protein